MANEIDSLKASRQRGDLNALKVGAIYILTWIGLVNCAIGTPIATKSGKRKTNVVHCIQKFTI